MLNAEQSKYLNDFEREVVKHCPKCHGSGDPCECWDALNLEYRCLKARIPLEHIVLTLDDIVNPDLENVKARIEKYITNLDDNLRAGKGLLLHGDYGTGKTSFGCMILREVMKIRPDGTRYDGYFASLEECVNLVTGGWKNMDSRDDFEQNIINTKVLLLDDVGGTEIKTNRGGNSELITSTFTSLFKERSNNLRPTIITTNLSPTAMQTQFGERVFSVMMQRLDFIKFDSKVDFRKEHSVNGHYKIKFKD